MSSKNDVFEHFGKAGLAPRSPPGPLPTPAKEEGHMVTTGQPFLCPADLFPTITQFDIFGQR